MQHKAGQTGFDLPEPEEGIRSAVKCFYIKQGNWLKENFESGEIYPAPEKVTPEYLDELINPVLSDRKQASFEPCRSRVITKP